MNQIIPLYHLQIGQKCKVKFLISEGLMRRRLLDLGVIPGAIIESLQASPSGDPIAYLIKGAVIALRSETASMVLVREF